MNKNPFLIFPALMVGSLLMVLIVTSAFLHQNLPSSLNLTASLSQPAPPLCPFEEGFTPFNVTATSSLALKQESLLLKAFLDKVENCKEDYNLNTCLALFQEYCVNQGKCTTHYSFSQPATITPEIKNLLCEEWNKRYLLLYEDNNWKYLTNLFNSKQTELPSYLINNRKSYLSWKQSLNTTTTTSEETFSNVNGIILINPPGNKYYNYRVPIGKRYYMLGIGSNVIKWEIKNINQDILQNAKIRLFYQYYDIKSDSNKDSLIIDNLPLSQTSYNWVISDTDLNRCRFNSSCSLFVSVYNVNEPPNSGEYYATATKVMSLFDTASIRINDPTLDCAGNEEAILNAVHSQYVSGKLQCCKNLTLYQWSCPELLPSCTNISEEPFLSICQKTLISAQQYGNCPEQARLQNYAGVCLQNAPNKKLSDLKVTGVSIYSPVGMGMITVFIKNSGIAPSNVRYDKVEIIQGDTDGIQLPKDPHAGYQDGIISQNPILPGENGNILINLEPRSYERKIKFKVMVDYLNMVPEVDEANNIFTQDITIPIAQNTVTIIPGTTTKTSTIKNKNACKVTAIAFPNPLPLNQDKVTIDAIGLVHTSKSRCQVELNEVGGWRSYDLPVTFIWPSSLNNYTYRVSCLGACTVPSGHCYDDCFSDITVVRSTSSESIVPTPDSSFIKSMIDLFKKVFTKQ